MGLLKKVVIGIIAFFLIFVSGAGTQSSNLILQGGGFIGLVLGAIVLYIFAKMAWRAMGCLPSILIVVAVLFFIFYAIGAFSGGLSNFKQNIKMFLGQGVETSSEFTSKAEDNNGVSKNTGDGIVNLVGEDEHPIITENFLESWFSEQEKSRQTVFNPLKYPAILGVSRVIDGNTLIVNRRIIKLYGIASPDITQTCADSSGRGYRCGRQALSWLSGWLADNEVKCHILSEDQHGVLTGVCLLGPYDIGAALTNVGWAVADTKQSKVYVPYQNQAISNRRGLWQGEFYMPWDWQKIKKRKANIKVLKKKKSRRSVWSNPLGD